MATTENGGGPAYAPVWKRAIAVLVDGFLISTLGGIIVFAVFDAPEPGAQLATGASLLWLLLYFGYYIGMEAGNEGQTVGKLLIGIRSVKDDGTPLDGNAATIRNLLRLVDIMPGLYLIGLVAILVSDEKQRVGDMLGNTHVVEA